MGTESRGEGPAVFGLGAQTQGRALPVGPGVIPNVAATLVVQAVTVALALALEALGFPEAAIVIVFVLGVIVTAIATEGRTYSFLSSVLAVLLFNLFLVEPRLSLRAWGPDYPETFAVMFLVALTASYLVGETRRSTRASMEAAALAQNEKLRAGLLRSVSHDLRTPLTAIMGSSDILLSDDGALDPGVRRRLAQDIHEDATWLSDVVDNLLAVTRLEDGSVSLALQVEAVDEVIEEALRHVRRDVAGHAIVVVPADEVLLARMDSSLVVQVIVNLVNNALAHTQQGSTVTVSARREGQLVAVTVADDGPGIAQEDRARVFERFFTSGALLEDGRRGIGLGLSLCKTIVEAHGGTIWVDDVSPHGAAFTFTLPLEEVSSYV